MVRDVVDVDSSDLPHSAPFTNALNSVNYSTNNDFTSITSYFSFTSELLAKGRAIELHKVNAVFHLALIFTAIACHDKQLKGKKDLRSADSNSPDFDK